jgi:hypothetical protein
VQRGRLVRELDADHGHVRSFSERRERRVRHALTSCRVAGLAAWNLSNDVRSVAAR